jgi:hypothetical protein
MRKLLKFGTALLLLLACITSASAEAAYEAYHPKIEKENSAEVFIRGTTNAALLPVETLSTLSREARDHNWLWPITYMPRMINNIIYRAASATNDILFMPFIAPFSDDTQPLTEGMGLPRYPWKIDP